MWKHTNLITFEDSLPNLSRVYNRILQDMGETKRATSYKVCRVDMPPFLHWDLTVGFFDGASQDLGSKCGANAVLKCPTKGTFKIKMNCGKGTNTRG